MAVAVRTADFSSMRPDFRAHGKPDRMSCTLWSSRSAWTTRQLSSLQNCDRLLDRRKRRRPILCIHRQPQFWRGSVRPRPIGPSSDASPAPPRGSPHAGSFPFIAGSEGHGYPQSPASASMPGGRTPRFWDYHSVHLQADVHTMRDEAVIIFSLHLVHSRRLVEAADVGNPTRQFIGSRGLACTSN